MGLRFMGLIVAGLMLAGLMLAGQAQAQVADLGGAAQGWLSQVRAQDGRGALTVSAPLTRAAAAHADDLAGSGRFSHEGSNGSSVGQRVRQQGYKFCFVAENIAKGQGSLQEVLEGWMASPGHRRNILAEQAVEFGLVQGPGNLWVMVLGRPGC